jgi:enoyl-CoA hydratase/carnithine racemase
VDRLGRRSPPGRRALNSPELLSQIESGVLTLTLNRPERRNALSPTLLAELLSALEGAARDETVRAVVLTGAGDRAFCAGADLSTIAESGEAGRRQREQGLFADVFTACNRLGKPLIGAVNGAALAGGLGLALSCDLLVAAEESTFGTPEVRVGLWPMMVMAVVQRHLGAKRAMELFLTGEPLSAAQAREWGLVNRVVPLPEVLPEAQRWAAEIAAASPLSLRLGRDAFHAIGAPELDAALRHLQARLQVLAASEDAREGSRAFRERRPPQFRGQ